MKINKGLERYMLQGLVLPPLPAYVDCVLSEWTSFLSYSVGFYLRHKGEKFVFRYVFPNSFKIIFMSFKNKSV